MRRIISGIAAVMVAGFLLLPTMTAYAHVTVSDDQGKGGVLHFDPDDNPKAGEVTTIYFDLEGIDHALEKATLDIRLGSAHLATVPLAVDSSELTSTYTFPEAGTYRLTFTVESGGENSVFDYERDVTGDSSETFLLSRPWALALLMGASAGLGVLVVVFVVRRAQIADQSGSKH